MNPTSVDVTAITLSRRRPALVERAIASVARQSYRIREHLVLIDDCRETERAVTRLVDDPAAPDLTYQYCHRPMGTTSGPGRSAVLRNLGVRAAKGAWIAFLDDDNLWEPNHIAELWATQQCTGASACYSHRTLWSAEGNPYLEQRFPWCEDEAEKARAFDRLARAGILQPGTNVMRDNHLAGELASVDTSEWLIRRDLLLRIPFREHYTEQDAATLTGEDDKLLTDLMAADIEIASSEIASLRYYLGGYSTTFGDNRSENIDWGAGAEPSPKVGGRA